ncbi:TetR family transcriptional regulator [Streptomonospora sp. S1-112]|uniref:TetR family transcriptional regulator n=1 Tax=Streptomonospora mangrovi TaxID=2883123 RepID=A0A9X3NP10_9ACTN|nr:TetR family transcriptional regulator [Streptomonospora mangrovi]MDA0566843.1 TetR family transcriptional regulator [Streptomonospora mangrovi]
MRSTEDLTARARIRDSALALFADHGPAAVSVAAVARAAGVSPALVIHHFQSKDGLRRACDAHVLALARGRPGEPADAASRDTAGLAAVLEEAGPARTYLARALLDGTPAAADLFDDLVAATAAWLEEGRREGWVRPSSTEPRAQAAVYVVWLLAPMAFGGHLSRALGTDLTGLDATLRVSRIGLEMLTGGLFADDRWLRAWDGVLARRSGAAPKEDT